MADVPEYYDELNIPDTPDTPDILDMPDTPDMLDIPDSPDILDIPDVSADPGPEAVVQAASTSGPAGKKKKKERLPKDQYIALKKKEAEEAEKARLKEMSEKGMKNRAAVRKYDEKVAQYLKDIRTKGHDKERLAQIQAGRVRDQEQSLVSAIIDWYGKPIGSSAEQVERAKGGKGAPLHSREYSLPPTAGPVGLQQPSTTATSVLGVLYEGVGEQYLPSTDHLLSFYQGPAKPVSIPYYKWELDERSGRRERVVASQEVPPPKGRRDLQGGWTYEVRPYDEASKAAMLGENAALLDDSDFRALLNELRANKGTPAEPEIRRRMSRMIGQYRTRDMTPDLMSWTARWEQNLKVNPSPLVVQQAVMDLRSRALSLLPKNAQAAQDMMAAGQKLLGLTGVQAPQASAAIQAGGAALSGLKPPDVLPTAPLLGPPVIAGKGRSLPQRPPVTDLVSQASAASRLGRVDAPLLKDVNRALSLALETRQVPPTGGLAPSVRLPNIDILTNLIKESRQAIPAPGAVPTGQTLASAVMEESLIRAIPQLPRHLQVKVMRTLQREGYIPEKVYTPVAGQYFQDRPAEEVEKLFSRRNQPVPIYPNAELYTSEKDAAKAASTLTKQLLVETLAKDSKKLGSARYKLIGRKGERTLLPYVPDPHAESRLSGLIRLLSDEDRPNTGLLDKYQNRISKVMGYLERTNEGDLKGLTRLRRQLNEALAGREAALKRLSSLFKTEEVLPPPVYGEAPRPPWALRSTAGKTPSGFQEKRPKLSPLEEAERTIRILDRRISRLSSMIQDLPESWQNEAYRLHNDRKLLGRLHANLTRIVNEKNPEARQELFKTLVEAILPGRKGGPSAPGTRVSRPATEADKLTVARERLIRKLRSWTSPKAQNQAADIISWMVETALEESGREGLERLGPKLPPKSAIAEVPLKRLLSKLTPSALVELIQGAPRGSGVQSGQVLPYRESLRPGITSQGAGAVRPRPGRVPPPAIRGRFIPTAGPLLLLLPLILRGILGSDGAYSEEAA